MPIKIYWGPPGSYKTASAVWDDVITCAREGRVLVTNIRGMSEQRCRDGLAGVVKQIPDTFKVIALRNHIEEELEKMRRWWHWAPYGAFIILDEVQAIYPPDWTAKQLHDLDCTEERIAPNGEALAKYVGLMFDMHRHGNWDLTFTTPSIKKVRSEIRAAAEIAYKHKNLAILGIKGRFMRFMHSAEDNGNPGDIYSSSMRKVPKHVFKLYESTATGAVQDSRAGINLFKSPRLLFLYVILALCGFYIATHRSSGLDGGETQSSDKPATSAPVVGSPDHGGDLQIPRARSQVTAAVTWRVSGIVEAGALSRALLTSSQGQTDMIVLTSCHKGVFNRWLCVYKDQTVAESYAPESRDAPAARSASDAAKG